MVKWKFAVGKHQLSVRQSARQTASQPISLLVSQLISQLAEIRIHREVASAKLFFRLL